MATYKIYETTIYAKTGDSIADAELSMVFDDESEAVECAIGMVDEGYLRDTFKAEAAGSLTSFKYAYGLEVHKLDEYGYFEEIVYSANYGSIEYNAEHK